MSPSVHGEGVKQIDTTQGVCRPIFFWAVCSPVILKQSGKKKTLQGNQLWTWWEMGPTWLFLLKTCYMNSSFKTKPGYKTSQEIGWLHQKKLLISFPVYVNLIGSHVVLFIMQFHREENEKTICHHNCCAVRLVWKIGRKLIHLNQVEFYKNGKGSTRCQICLQGFLSRYLKKFVMRILKNFFE